MRNFLQKTLARLGYRIQRSDHPDMGKGFLLIHKRVGEFTMTSIERQYALYQAVNYIAGNSIPGDIVECGVWKGGSAMLAAIVLKERGNIDRKIYLYDTFAGMSRPTEKDVNINGKAAEGKWKSLMREKINEWDYASLKEVRSRLSSVGYPAQNLVFVEGLVEETIPRIMPEKIALLRLDTDWYESTRHELEHLFPRLSEGGVLIIDDYGHWKGAREAVDEYCKKNKIKILLNRIDYTGRIGIK